MTPGLREDKGEGSSGMRDLPITKTEIMLTHSCHWADTSTIVIERKDVMKD
jgi:hypothetical protein